MGQIDNLKNKTSEWSEMDDWEKLGYVQEKFSELASGINSALSLVSETLDNQTSADVQSLENAYKKGLISEEEYYSKKEKIEKAEADVIAAKKKYDQATANLKELLDKRDAIRKEEILSAVVKSGRSYEEIMNFLNAGSDGEKTEK